LNPVTITRLARMLSLEDAQRAAPRRLWALRGNNIAVDCDLIRGQGAGWEVRIISLGKAITSRSFSMRSDAERFAEEQRLAIRAWVACTGHR
jgi:hypothetical protein